MSSPLEQPSEPEPSPVADGADGATTVMVTISDMASKKITFSAAPSDTIRSVKLKWCEFAGLEEERCTSPGHPDGLCGLLDIKRTQIKSHIYVGASTDRSFGSRIDDPDKDELTLESCGYGVGSDCKLLWTPNQCSS